MKTLYRSPIKTLLTFILIAVVTFAFFSHTAEYAITAREFKNAAKLYCGVGSAEVAPPADSRNYGDPDYINADPRIAQLYPEEQKEKYLNELRYQPLTQEQVSAISALPYITSADTRFMTAGLSDSFYRLDDGANFYDFSARCVIEGTLTEVKYGDPAAIWDVVHGFNRLILNDCTLLAGNPAWPVDNETLTVYAAPMAYDDGAYIGGGNQRLTLMLTSDYIYDTAYVKNMTPGSRFVFVLRFDSLDQRNYPESKHVFYLGDYLSDSWCNTVWPLDGAPDDYLETDAFAPLRELAQITNSDMHTFDMVYTDDMSAIMRFAEDKMAILDGRALTRVDSASGLNVCVVSREFAKANALKVGDTITMKLGTDLFEQHKALGAVAVTRERYQSAEKPVTLEIVGIYVDKDGRNQQSKKPNWSYSINTVFVPKSLLPVDAKSLSGHVFSPSEFSFKVENAWDIPAFLEESAPKFAEMGLKLVFDDDGWPDIVHGFQAARQLSLIKIAVLSSAVAAAIVFVVFLFIGRKKKEYAVMRALGTTRRVSARALILPLMAVAVVSVLVGSAASWIYTVKTIAHNNTLSLLKEYDVSTTIPTGAALICIVGEILLALLIALVLLRRIGALSPLSLLQDNGTNRARRRNKTGRKKMPGRKNAAGTETKAPELTAPSMPLISTPAQTGAPTHIAALNATATLTETARDNAASEPTDTARPNDTAEPTDTAAPNETAAVTVDPAQVGRTGGPTGFVLRYIGKHMRRSAGKSVLSVLLAVLLFAAVGQLGLMKQSYTQLCTDTVITANFVGGLPLTSMPSIIRSEFVKNPYYEATVTADLNNAKSSIVFTNNIPRYTGENAEITYADGFDASCMDKLGQIMIAGKTLMMKYGLKPGDTVKLTREGYYFGLKQQYITEYRGAHAGDTITDEEILALFQDRIKELISYVARTYTIAGVVTTASGAYDDMAFTPGAGDGPFGVGTVVKLDVAEVTLADNFRADEFRSYGKKLAGGSATDGVVFMMDTSKLENLRNSLRLLETLYPIVLTAALLIGGFLCCLVIVQSSKEAAIMRVLGTTKRRTRVMLALEQVLLSIGGLVIGVCGLLLYRGPALLVILQQLCMFAALYLIIIMVSAVTCSALATRRNVLELLQTKE